MGHLYRPKGYCNFQQLLLIDELQQREQSAPAAAWDECEVGCEIPVSNEIKEPRCVGWSVR